MKRIIFIIFIVGGIAWGLTRVGECDKNYCEHWRYSWQINNKFVEDIRRRTLENIHYIEKNNLDMCGQRVSTRTVRDVWNRYQVIIKCSSGKTVKLPLENEYVWVKFDEAFSENSFLWDDVFISWWMDKTDAQLSRSTLDYWYSQQIDEGKNVGLIPREIDPTQKSFWELSDKSVSAPMLMGEVEMEIYKKENNLERVKQIVPKLIKYYWWVESNRKKTVDGVDIYTWSGLGSGMDNSPRCPDNFDCGYSDLIAQQALLAKNIVELSKIAEDGNNVNVYSKEYRRLAEQIRKNYWDKTTGFVYDVDNNGDKIMDKETVAGIWSVYAQVLSEEETKEMIKNYLLNKNKFGGVLSFPSVAKDSVYYSTEGDYWRGGIWPPILWIGYLSLKNNGYVNESQSIAKEYFELFKNVWTEKGTLYEYYKPVLENGKMVPGAISESKPDFFGWGMLPLQLYFEINKL